MYNRDSMTCFFFSFCFSYASLSLNSVGTILEGFVWSTSLIKKILVFFSIIVIDFNFCTPLKDSTCVDMVTIMFLILGGVVWSATLIKNNSYFINFIIAIDSNFCAPLKDCHQCRYGYKNGSDLEGVVLVMQMLVSLLKLCRQTLITWMLTTISLLIPLTFQFPLDQMKNFTNTLHQSVQKYVLILDPDRWKSTLNTLFLRFPSNQSFMCRFSCQII